MKDNFRNDVNKKNSDGSKSYETKLNFTDDEDDSILVFEHEISTKPKKDKSKNASSAETPSKQKEFELPEKYTVNKKYNSSRMIVDETPTVKHAYMPKFTEVSQNYRVSETPKVRKKITMKKVDELSSDNGVEIGNADSINPTAESVEENELSGAKLVTMGVQAPEKHELKSTILKFEKNNSKDDGEEKNAEDAENQSSEETGFIVISEEASADDVFANDEINYSVIGNSKNNDRASEEDIAAIEETVSSEELVAEAQPVEEPVIEEYKIPDPEVIVIDVPDPGELSIPKKEPEEFVNPAAENVGDNPINEKAGGAEYTSYTQRDGLKDKFLDTIMSIKVRLFASIALAIVALVFENLSLFGVNLPALMGMNKIPGAMAIIDLPILVCLFVLALPEVVLAIRRLILGRATPELFILASFAVAIAYYSVIILYTPLKYPLFGLVFAIFCVGAISASLFKKLADFSNFKMVSINAEKKIVDKKFTRTLTEESFALDGKIESYKSKIARVFRVNFVSGFFKRSGKCSENSNNVIFVLVATFGLAFVSAAIAFFIPGGITATAMTFATVFMFGIPVFTILTHKLPFYHSSVEAMHENSAIIGESTFYDYSGIDVITFQDSEVFGEDDINLQRIMLYGKNENLSKAMHQMAAIFSSVGGPLERLFANAIDQKPAYATNVVIEEDGILGEIFGKEVRAGSREYMKRYGVIFPEETLKENGYNSTKIMYAAEDGAVYAKFYVRYTLSEEFTMQLPSLFDEGIVPLIYTRDPNINSELLRSLTAGSDSIRVLKKFNLPEGEDKLYHRVNAGLVTMGDKTNVINMILMSKKYVRFQARIAITEITAMLVGCVLAVVLSLGSMVASIPSFAFAIWQAVWCGALFFMSLRTLRTDRRISKKEKHK